MFCLHFKKKEVSKNRVVGLPNCYIRVMKCKKCGKKIYKLVKSEERFFVRKRKIKEQKITAEF